MRTAAIRWVRALIGHFHPDGRRQGIVRWLPPPGLPNSKPRSSFQDGDTNGTRLHGHPQFPRRATRGWSGPARATTGDQCHVATRTQRAEGDVDRGRRRLGSRPRTYAPPPTTSTHSTRSAAFASQPERAGRSAEPPVATLAIAGWRRTVRALTMTHVPRRGAWCSPRTTFS